MTEAERLFAKHNDETTTYHTAVRDGSVWWCPRCKRVLGPFGAGMPQTEADCVPHRWGDGAA
jgi:hypothetical protein